jgi:hypothetical protein
VKNAFKIFVVKLKRRDNLDVEGVGRKKILKWILKYKSDFGKL